MDVWGSCGPDEKSTPPATQSPADNHKYTVSLVAFVTVLFLLWTLRPPFVCAAAKGMRTPQLQAGRVLAISLAVAVAVLVAPACAPLQKRVQAMWQSTR